MIRKLTSRKLWAWIGACALLAAGQIDQHTWLYVTVAYMGGQALIDAVKHWRNV